MFRQIFLAIALSLTAPAVSAQSVQDQIISQLQAQGFSRIEIYNTLLGRVRLKAYSTTLERELVFNPATGQILRDVWVDRSDGDTKARVSDPTGRRDDRSGSGSGGGDDRSGSNRGSDDDDDDDDDDRSGSNSGSSADRDDDDDDRRGRGRGRGRGGDDDDDDDDDKDDDDDD